VVVGVVVDPRPMAFLIASMIVVRLIERLIERCVCSFGVEWRSEEYDVERSELSREVSFVYERRK
jgi:hypothetical protein